MTNFSKLTKRLNNTVDSLNFAKMFDDRELDKSFESAIKDGILPNIFEEQNMGRFKIVNALNNNRILGAGWIAKMAKIYTSKAKIYILQKKITAQDVYELKADNVTDAFANIMEELIDKATDTVSATVQKDATLAMGSRDTGRGFFN